MNMFIYIHMYIQKAILLFLQLEIIISLGQEFKKNLNHFKQQSSEKQGGLKTVVCIEKTIVEIHFLIFCEKNSETLTQKPQYEYFPYFLRTLCVTLFMSQHFSFHHHQFLLRTAKLEDSFSFYIKILEMEGKVNLSFTSS